MTVAADTWLQGLDEHLEAEPGPLAVIVGRSYVMRWEPPAPGEGLPPLLGTLSDAEIDGEVVGVWPPEREPDLGWGGW